MMAPRAVGTQERYGRHKRYREDIPAPIDDTSKHIPPMLSGCPYRSCVPINMDSSQFPALSARTHPL